MEGVSKLTVVASVLALLALSSAQVELAHANPSSPPSTASTASTAGWVPQAGAPICEAKPHTARDAATAAELGDIGARLAATPVEDDVIPLNNQGYNYQADQRPSNEVLFMDAELQSQR